MDDVFFSWERSGDACPSTRLLRPWRAGTLGLSLTLTAASLVVACQSPPGTPPPSPDGGTTPAGPSLAAGAGHTCAIFAAGAVRCWGDNKLGQLGRAAGNDPLAAYSVDLGRGARAAGVYAGLSDTCVVLDGGAVKCWGDNSLGQLGLGDNVTRGDGMGAMGDALPVVDLGVGRRAVSLAVGSTAVCALFDDGAVKCWGDAYQGATGHGDIITRGDRPGTMGDNLPTVDLGSAGGVPFKATAIAAFDYHSFCAILADTGADNSSLKCWGSNDYCELGLGTHDNGHGSMPGTMGNGLPWVDLGTTAAGTARKAVALGGGYQSTCVIGDDGAVNCWGQDGSGQLGDGQTGTERSCLPGEIGDANRLPLPAAAAAVAMRGESDGGGAHACALLVSGAVSCWGENGFGQLGTGDTTALPSPSPPLVFPDGFVTAKLVLGNDHTCAVAVDRRVECWGSDQLGQLGPTAVGDVHAPGMDLRLRGRAVVALAAGADHTCALLDGGALKCWGRNDAGQLGLGDLVNRGDGAGEMGDNLPEVSLGGPTIAVAAGAAHTCAVTGDGAVRCWGAGDAGQLGLGTETGALAPPATAIALPAAAIAVAAGADFSCALLGDGQVACWGAGARGQLGSGDLGGRAAPASAVSLTAKATLLAAGTHHACALLANDRLTCWGANDSGQLGLGDTADHPLPALVDAGTARVRAVAAGGDATCVMLDGGAVKCWGANDRGQLGLGDAVTRAAPEANAVALGSGRSASVVTVGGAFACALVDTSQAKCWGDNQAAELGTLSNAPACGDGPDEMGDFLPQASQGGGRSVQGFAAGRAHVCAILDTGDVRCWGDNTYGQLAAGDAGAHSAVVNPTGVVDLGRDLGRDLGGPS
jgi:alpha-tubulin suppressor-like RCC1 family protein